MYKGILILHGVGDFIASESYLTDAECNAVETIYWASAHRKFLQPSIKWNELFPNLKNHQILWDDWGTPEQHQTLEKRFKIENKHELIFIDKNIDPFWITTALLDSGVPQICDDIANKRRGYQGSRIAKMKFDPPAHLNLPDKYVLIHPWSDAHRLTARDFTDEDWEGVLGFLEKNNITGIVTNKSKDYAPQHPKIIDLTNQTTLQETFALAQRATYFMGCASCLHVFTPKVLPSQNIFIKSKYPWLAKRSREFMFYHAPATENLNFKVYPSLNFLKDYIL